MRDSGSVLAEYEASYFMASTDTTETLSKFAKSNGARFPMLSDRNGKAAKAFGAFNVLGFAKRWTFYVDDSGTIVKIDKEVSPRTAGEQLSKNLDLLGFPRKK
ncbi:MAG: hypothetical protein CMQ40_04710 [Gammaproteobacteria bacterium]|nr:hypothetical protein [Gammaproteobacteria bacterium]